MHMYPKVKICGVKSIKEVEIINNYPVNYVGFIFAESKRKVTIEEAIILKKALSKNIKIVGVFVNENVDNINKIVNKCGLDIVQLHGEEEVEYCSKVNAKVWKAIPIENKKSINNIYNYYQAVDGILLETYSKNARGGTGKSFNWQLAKNVKDTFKDTNIILAGGLNPININDAIEIINPDIIDLNSGLEINGYKDKDKIDKLFSKLGGINKYEIK